MLDRIRLFVVSQVSRFDELPFAAQLALAGGSLIAVVIAGHHFGVLSKGNPMGIIPGSWHHAH